MEPNEDSKALSADEALHDDLHRALCALALGELHGDEARALEARLASEPELAAQYDELRATIELVRTSLARAEALPAAHMERVLSGARAHAAPQTAIHDLAWYRRPAVRLAASLVLCAGAGFVGLQLMQTKADEGHFKDRTELAKRGTLAAPADALPRLASDKAEPQPESEAQLVDRSNVAQHELSPDALSVGEAKNKAVEGSEAQWVQREELGQLAVSATDKAVELGVAPTAVPDAYVDLTLVEDVTNGLEEMAALGLDVAGASVDGANVAGAPSAGFFFESAAGLAGGGSGGTGSNVNAPQSAAGESAPGESGSFVGLAATTPAPTGQSVVPQDAFIRDRASATPLTALDPRTPTGGAVSPGTDLRHVDLDSEIRALGGLSEAGAFALASSTAPGAPPVTLAPPESKEQAVTERLKLPATDLDPAAYKRRAGLEPAPAPDPASQPTAAGRALDLPAREVLHDDLTQRLGEYRDNAPNGNPRLTDEQFGRVVEQEWQRLHAECQRYPNERPRDMYFRFWGDNAFVRTGEDAQSTFGADVDTASYALARRYLREGRAPERAQIRTEEFVNAFTPDLAPPTEETFGLHVELAPTPFGEDRNHWLVRVGVRGKEVAKGERQPLNLTFVVDTSGSMREGNRLELVKHAMRLLVTQLDARDTIAIVAYSNDARQILAPTSAAHRDLIESAIHPLSPNGSTNAEAGLRMGYALAETTLAPGAHSRIVFLSDGVANVGQTDQDRINADVKRFRDAGIFLNTIGVGMNNHNDTFLEQLANKGDGICDYVDDGAAAEKAIVERFTGAFVPIASDVKLQVEFDPAQVLRWRQLGYENRAIADQDFRNDNIDAGEVGAGHQVTCLYEVELADGIADTRDRQDAAKALATLRVRWKAPKGARQDPNEVDVFERETAVSYSAAVSSFRAASFGFRRSALAAQLAEFLRRSSHARMDDYALLVGEALALIDASPRAAGQVAGAATSTFTQEIVELADLVRRADGLGFGQRPSVTDLERTLDEYRRYQYLRATIQELRSEGDPLLRQIEDMNQTLEQQIRDLLRRDLQKRNG